MKYFNARTLAITFDIVMIPLAWMSAHWLRFNPDPIPLDILETAWFFLPFVMLSQVAAYWSFGLYRGIWRYASLPDLMRIMKAVAAGCLISLVFMFLVSRAHGVPRSAFILYGMTLLLLLGGARFFVRWIKDRNVWFNTAKRVLIVGAGQAGEGMIRDLGRDRSRQYKPVALVDDHKSKRGKEIHGVRVLGNTRKIPELVKKHRVDAIILAIPSVRPEAMRRIVRICKSTGLPIRTLPSVSDLVSGRVSLDLLREISLEDMIGRAEVKLDWSELSEDYSNRVVLVTGAGGSIGSWLCRQVANLKPKRLVMIDHSEFNLFSITHEFEQKHPDIVVERHLVDVRDKEEIFRILKQAQPEIVLHAAAYKHVPMLEDQIREAVRCNILGTCYLAQTALSVGVKKFVLVSTDKAVNPANVMGASKRASEIVCNALNYQGSTQFIAVRFGNVLDSAGSVVPIFKQQIKAGGPITVTHPDISRYFMTIPEATQLIIQASVLGHGGETFVLDMGEPIKISYLAEQMIKFAGKKPGEDIKITFTGLRPGEKLYEELFYQHEDLQPTEHRKIMRAKSDNVDWVHVKSLLEQMEQACGDNDVASLNNLLRGLVPEYAKLLETIQDDESVSSSLVVDAP